MKRFVGILVGIAVGAPRVAATPFIDMRTGPNFGQGEVDAVVAPGSGEHFFDLTFLQSEEDPDDQMNEYDVMVRASRPGITLLRAQKPDNWVFTDPDAVLTVVEGNAGHLLINASSPDERVDITRPPKNAARVYYSLDAGAAPGRYSITLEPSTTRLYTANTSGWVPPFVGVTDPGLVLVTPEPSGLTILAVGGVLALRRRRLQPAPSRQHPPKVETDHPHLSLGSIAGADWRVGRGRGPE
jgi:hypothetical protein